MIEINLSPQQKDNPLASLGGINLSLLSVKGIFIAFIIFYAYEPIMNSYYEDVNSEIDEKKKTIRSEQIKLTKQLQELNSVKTKVEDLERKERLVQERIIIVKKIVDKRQNPHKVLRYIAENTPKDVWIESLNLQDKSFRLVGYSKSWKSIADFLENLKSSIFFSGRISYSKNPGARSIIDNVRVEPFQITATVERFK